MGWLRHTCPVSFAVIILSLFGRHIPWISSGDNDRRPCTRVCARYQNGNGRTFVLIAWLA
jgi:hypothetical protein